MMVENSMSSKVPPLPMLFEVLIDPFTRNSLLQRQLSHDTGRCFFSKRASNSALIVCISLTETSGFLPKTLKGMALCRNQILHCDCLVGEARRIDLDLLADQPLADHELLRAIDAINRNNLAMLEIEGGEAAPFQPVAPHHDALVTLAEADDLQLDESPRIL